MTPPLPTAWNERQRAAKRARVQRIADHITAAGAAGKNLPELQADGFPRSSWGVFLSQASSAGLLWRVRLTIDGTIHTRYYGRAEWALAFRLSGARPPVKKAERMRIVGAMPERRPMGRPSTSRAAVLGALVAAGAEGVTAEQITDATGVSGHQVKAQIYILRQLGTPVGSRRLIRQPARYWADVALMPPKPEKPKRVKKPKPPKVRAVKAAPAPKPPKPPKPVCMPKIVQPPRAMRQAGPAREALPVDYSRAVFTVCPSGKDHRFTAGQVTPMFSQMAPGNYLPGDTWAARAYA